MTAGHNQAQNSSVNRLPCSSNALRSWIVATAANGDLAAASLSKDVRARFRVVVNLGILQEIVETCL